MKTCRLIPLLVALGLSVAGCSTLDALNPWASSDPKMAPLTPITAEAEVRTVWSASVGKAGNYAFVPAVVGSAVYVADRNGNVSKLVDGRPVWSIKAGQALSSGVGANALLVVVGTPKGDVLAFSTEDGSPRWRAKVSSEVLAPPAIGDAGVAVRSGDHRIFLFDAHDGGRKWVYQRASPTLSLRSSAPPILADRFVFAGFPGGKLVALSVQNGAPIWEGTVASPKGATELDRIADIAGVPALDGRQICAIAFQGRVACFDMGQGGVLMWARDMSSASGVALDNRFLFVTDERGAVHALDRTSGSSLWKQDKLLNRQVSAPAVSGKFVAVADAEGIVHVLDREDGHFVARQKTDGSPVRTPVLNAGSDFLVQTTGGSVNLIEAR